MTPDLIQAALQPPSFFSYWKEILGTLAAFSATVGFVLAAVADKLWVWSHDRCKETIMARLNEWFSERIAANAKAVRIADANSDRLVAFEASLMQQGLTLKTQLESHFAQNTVALQAVTTALQAVQREAQATAEDVAHIRGYMEAAGEWDGSNRRTRTRRKAGGQP